MIASPGNATQAALGTMERPQHLPISCGPTFLVKLHISQLYLTNTAGNSCLHITTIVAHASNMPNK